MKYVAVITVCMLCVLGIFICTLGVISVVLEFLFSRFNESIFLAIKNIRQVIVEIKTNYGV